MLEEPERSANEEGAENTENFVVQLDGKRLLVVELSNLETNKSRKAEIVTSNVATFALANIEWTKCFICQKETSEKLQCPLNSPLPKVAENAKKTYATIAENLQAFKDAGKLPGTVKLDSLQEGGPLKDELYRKEGKYHKSCRLKYATSKLPVTQK